MKRASQYRLTARNMLKNNWGIAVLAGFIAVLLGAVSVSSLDLNFDLSNINIEEIISKMETGSLLTDMNPLLYFLIHGGTYLIVILSAAYSIAMFGVGAIVAVGYASFNLHMENEKPTINRMFGYFPSWKNIVWSRFLRWLFVFLWTLLLIIPGIIAAFNYAMTDFILAENPNMPAREAMNRSKEMMAGNRWKLFCLQFSFIGWWILSLFTFGIGGLFLVPYTNAALVPFYQDLKNYSGVNENFNYNDFQ